MQHYGLCTRAGDGLLLGVLDDDPTGSQAVHGVEVVTVLEQEAHGAALAGPAAACFVLNSMEEPGAAGTMCGRRVLSVRRETASRGYDGVMRACRWVLGQCLIDPQPGLRTRRQVTLDQVRISFCAAFSAIALLPLSLVPPGKPE